jgi:hypothetical protein
LIRKNLLKTRPEKSRLKTFFFPGLTRPFVLRLMMVSLPAAWKTFRN